MNNPTRIEFCTLHRMEAIEGRGFCPQYTYLQDEEVEDCYGHIIDLVPDDTLQQIADEFANATSTWLDIMKDWPEMYVLLNALKHDIPQ